MLRRIPGRHLLKGNSLHFLTGKTPKRRFFDLKYNTTVQICLQNVLKQKKQYRFRFYYLIRQSDTSMILDYIFCNFTHLIFRQSYKKIKILRDVYKNNGNIFFTKENAIQI